MILSPTPAKCASSGATATPPASSSIRAISKSSTPPPRGCSNAALGMTKYQMFKALPFSGFPLVRTHAQVHQADALRRRRDRRHQGHVRPYQFRHRAQAQPRRRPLRRMRGKAGLGGARPGRAAEIASGAGSGAGEVRRVEPSRLRGDGGGRAERCRCKQTQSISAAIFFRSCRKRLRSRMPMTRSRLRSCRRAQRVSMVSVFLPSGVRFRL